MVIIFSFLGAIAFFASIMFLKNRGWRALMVTITGIIFVGSTVLMTLNYSHHFGMEKVTTTRTQRIYPTTKSMPLALYQPVGTSGKDDVYIYNTKVNQSKPNHTQANEFTHNKVKCTNKTDVRLVTTETRWKFKNNFYKVLYAWSGIDGTLVSRTNTFEYPRTYVKVSVKQAKQLAKAAKSPAAAKAQAAAKQQGQAYVTGKVQAAMAKNPRMTAHQIQQISQQAEQEFQARMVKQMLKQ